MLMSIQIAPTMKDMGRGPGSEPYDEACAESARRALRRYRDYREWNDTQLAEAIGLTQPAISKILHSPDPVRRLPTQPSLPTLIRFSKLSKWSLDLILGLRVDPTTKLEERIDRLEKAIPKDRPSTKRIATRRR